MPKHRDLAGVSQGRRRTRQPALLTYHSLWLLARAFRERFREAGADVVSLVSSPGAGKTAFLERSLTALRPLLPVAALVVDLATDNEAARLARCQVPVRQITTVTVYHLDAAMVERALAGWDINELDILSIERFIAEVESNRPTLSAIESVEWRDDLKPAN